MFKFWNWVLHANLGQKSAKISKTLKKGQKNICTQATSYLS